MQRDGTRESFTAFSNHERDICEIQHTLSELSKLQ